jgi:cytochrome c553
MKAPRFGYGVVAVVVTAVAGSAPIVSRAADNYQVIAQAASTTGQDSAPAVAITADARAQAAEIFTSRCATCHGEQGRGNGPAAANLNPRPINFHSRKWQHSVTDAKIAQAIVEGGKAVGVSGEMAPNPDLENEPAVVAALVERVRKLGK